MKLCEIDKAVLAAHEAGKDWKSVRSARRFGRVLTRAKRRKAVQR
jgi:acyl-CoA reductase-like NAD-dependent aldehyde dehydrogenase